MLTYERFDERLGLAHVRDLDGDIGEAPGEQLVAADAIRERPLWIPRP